MSDLITECTPLVIAVVPDRIRIDEKNYAYPKLACEVQFGIGILFEVYHPRESGHIVCELRREGTDTYYYE